MGTDMYNLVKETKVNENISVNTMIMWYCGIHIDKDNHICAKKTL